MKRLFSLLFILISSVQVSGEESPSKISVLKNKFPGLKSEYIKFSKTDIRDIIRFFSAEYGLNIVSNPNVKGITSFEFEKINPIDAFDSLLTAQGYNWHMDKGIIYVYSQSPVTIMKLNYAVAEEVVESLGSIVSDVGTIGVSRASNSLIIKAPQNDINKIRSVVNKLDQSPLQVLVEVKILELQADSKNGLGLGQIYSQANGTSAQTQGFANQVSQTTASGLFVRVLKDDLQLILEALETRTGVDLLATPKILAINHKPASIITGQRLGYKTNSTSSTGTIINETVNFLEVGTKLNFTPHISDNGDIIMEIKPEVSEGTIAEDGLPQETTTETETNVLVRDGQTILLGGLIREKTVNTESGIPLLVDIPFIGDLFKKTTVAKEKKETIVLITPHLITPERLKEMEKSYPKSAMQSRISQ